jgi:transposase InsO family protein
VVTDNGPCYKAAAFARYIRERPECEHVRTRHRSPGTNGKAERLIRTMLAECASGAIYRDSEQRTTPLSGWLDHYNHRRPHGALSHQPPASRHAS